MWFWSMKTGLSVHGTPKRGITPTTRKKHGRHPFLSLLTATLSNRFHKFVCLKSLKRRQSKRQDPSPFPPFYQCPDNTLAPTTYGKSNRLCKLPGHYLGKQQKTNMQPMAPATSSKSELLFALYLYPVCVSTGTLCQAVSAAVGTGCRPWGTATNKSPEQVRHRDHCCNSWFTVELHHQVPTRGTTQGGLKGWSFTYRKQEMCQASLTVLWRRCPAAMLSPHPRHLQTSSPACSNKVTNSNQFIPEKTKIASSFIKNNLKLSNWQESYRQSITPEWDLPNQTLTSCLFFFLQTWHLLLPILQKKKIWLFT